MQTPIFAPDNNERESARRVAAMPEEARTPAPPTPQELERRKSRSFIYTREEFRAFSGRDMTFA